MEISVDKYIGILTESRNLSVCSLVTQPNRAAVEDTVGAIKVTDDLIALLNELKIRREIMADVTKLGKQEREKNNENT